MGKPTFRPPARQAPFANAADAYDFVFRDETASKLDVIKPGYFNQHRSELIVGTMIECRLGHPADGCVVFRVQVIDNPKWVRGTDVLVSVGKAQTFTPVRHSGEAADETDAVKEKEGQDRNNAFGLGAR